jgi:anaerobic ribonucleoside-triphosphate reductase activating protein
MLRMNYHDIKHSNMVNGDWLRTVIWVSGCSHRCSGCFNTQTHCPASGTVFDDNAKNELFKYLNTDWCDGVTFSGGDPLFETNVSTILDLCKEIKTKYPTKTIWLYTGYTWEAIIHDINRSKILKYIDILVDGPFIESLADKKLKWVGSSNQNIIDVQARLSLISSIFS